MYADDHISLALKCNFFYHCLRRDISNYSLIKNRNHAGILISMHQSGTHWLKHMLASAITHELGLPPPKFIHANDIIGGVKDPRVYPQVPRLVMSHSIPPMILKSEFFRRLIKLPRHVLLVRDCRASLVSNYDKWKETYNCNFSEYLRGDMKGHRFNNDIWWCIRYYNAWGPIDPKK